jgi:antitoxin (DNA-binding transcriptional repressor) of toxin-antitoxin stability system
MLSLGVNEFIERIDEMLRLVEEEGETIDILQCGEVVARIVPAQYQAQTTIGLT